MFTGLVTEVGQVVALATRSGGAVLKVRAPGAAAGAALGDSIAVDGACLTVTAKSGHELSFDLSGETLGATTLGAARTGRSVNIEPALAAGARLGGHMVTGHVDAVGRIAEVSAEGIATRLTVEAPPEVMRLLVDKGSVAVDGVSLTVAGLMEARGAFGLVIVPHTARETTIARKRPGDRVNLETDIIGKYVWSYLNKAAAPPAGGGGIEEALRRGGFV
jgi:riboflavin synthase